MTTKMTELLERLGREDFHYLSLERAHGETYSHPEPVLYGHGTYGRSSVLAGRSSRVFLESWETFEEAREELSAAGIEFEEPGFSSHVPVEEVIAHIPKTDYDREGEEWDKVAKL